MSLELDIRITDNGEEFSDVLMENGGVMIPINGGSIVIERRDMEDEFLSGTEITVFDIEGDILEICLLPKYYSVVEWIEKGGVNCKYEVAPIPEESELSD